MEAGRGEKKGGREKDLSSSALSFIRTIYNKDSAFITSCSFLNSYP
jgi:hypothetical protein